MASIHRLIFRVDFDHHYRLADQPGTIIQTILDASHDYWEIVGPTNTVFQINAANGITGDATNPRARANFSVDTFAIAGNLEIPKGIAFEDILEDEFLSVCSHALDEIITHFGIRNFNRVGLRLFITGGKTKDFDAHREVVARRFAKIAVPKNLLNGIILSDFAQILVGKLEHDIKFRLQSGPGNSPDLQQFLQREISEKELNRPPHEFTADIDIFQENINFRGTSLLRWIKAKQPYLTKLLDIAKHSARSEHENHG